jgi:hypothetical protein
VQCLLIPPGHDEFRDEDLEPPLSHDQVRAAKLLPDLGVCVEDKEVALRD